MIEDAIFEEVIAAVANYIAAEEHLLETARTIQDKEQARKYALLSSILRKMRQQLMYLLVNANKAASDGKFRTELGEVWCATKHLLLIKVHLFETAQKFADLGDEENMMKIIEQAENVNKILMEFLDTVIGNEPA